MTRISTGLISYVKDKPRHISGKTTRVLTDYVAPGIGVDLVERVTFTYTNGVCKVNVEGRKYAFRTKEARLCDDLRVVLEYQDDKLEAYRVEDKK